MLINDIKSGISYKMKWTLGLINVVQYVNNTGKKVIVMQFQKNCFFFFKVKERVYYLTEKQTDRIICI